MKYSPCPRCREKGNDNRGDNLVTFNDGGSHCFACGFHVPVKYYVPRRLEINEVKANRPYDFTREVPNDALKWLLQYGLPWSHWKETIGYSPSAKRLVFTLPTFSIGRYIGQIPDNERKWKVWGDSHVTAESFGKPQDTAILVEDLVSAHKVADAGLLTLCLFGVKVYPCHIKWLRNNIKNIIIWLDKDQAGSIMRTCDKTQLLTGLPTKYIVTDNDPKSLSKETILNAIKTYN